MRIWLDDIRPAPEGFIHIKNLREFQDLLGSNADIIDTMSFDHDLGENEPDGYQIAQWLAEHHLGRWPLEVRVHSSNPPGAANIRAYDEFVRTRLCVELGATVMKCAICDRPVKTCERERPLGNDYRCPVHPDGVELTDGRWVCSDTCYGIIVEKDLL